MLMGKEAENSNRNTRISEVNPKSHEVTEDGFHNTGASTQCRTRVLIGSRGWDNRREPKSTTEEYN